MGGLVLLNSTLQSGNSESGGTLWYNRNKSKNLGNCVGARKLFWGWLNQENSEALKVLYLFLFCVSS